MSKTTNFTFGRASDSDLKDILKLQSNNLKVNVDNDEVTKEGYVTLVHTESLLKKMNSPHPHVICKDGEQLVAYALVMMPELQDEIELLKPMFQRINDIHSESGWEGRYFIMGQICIAKTHRRQGIFKGLYDHMARAMTGHADKIVTEVNAENTRSLNAHLHSNFSILLEYNADGEDWVIVERALV